MFSVRDPHFEFLEHTQQMKQNEDDQDDEKHVKDVHVSPNS